jgi:hypothetical protein
LASATKPPRKARRLSVPMKLVTMLADWALERCRAPTRYVTMFVETPITPTRSASSVPGTPGQHHLIRNTHERNMASISTYRR